MRILLTAPVYISQDVHYDFIKETIDSIVTKYEYDVVLVNNYIKQGYEQKVKNLCSTLLSNPLGNNVSSAWNEGIKYGLANGFDYVFIINLDIIFNPEAIDNLVAFAEKNGRNKLYTCSEWQNRSTIKAIDIVDNGEALELHTIKSDDVWQYSDEHPHFSCFAVTKEFIEAMEKYEQGLKETKPGYFDTNFNKAYFEDQDYHQRILIAKANGVDVNAIKVNSAVFYHYGSRTIKSDEQLELENNINYELNRQYFKTKFGYDSHGQVPTNDERVKMGYKTPFNEPRQ